MLGGVQDLRVPVEDLSRGLPGGRCHDLVFCCQSIAIIGLQHARGTGQKLARAESAPSRQASCTAPCSPTAKVVKLLELEFSQQVQLSQGVLVVIDAFVLLALVFSVVLQRGAEPEVYRLVHQLASTSWQVLLSP